MKFSMEGKSVCVDSADERADLGLAIHQAARQAEPYPNLLVRITVETVNRPVLQNSEWKRRNKTLELVEVVYIAPSDDVIFRDLEGHQGILHLRNWHDTFEWISNP